MSWRRFGNAQLYSVTLGIPLAARRRREAWRNVRCREFFSHEKPQTSEITLVRLKSSQLVPLFVRDDLKVAQLCDCRGPTQSIAIDGGDMTPS